MVFAGYLRVDGFGALGLADKGNRSPEGSEVGSDRVIPYTWSMPTPVGPPPPDPDDPDLWDWDDDSDFGPRRRWLQTIVVGVVVLGLVLLLLVSVL
jgi:hypothetical protein